MRSRIPAFAEREECARGMRRFPCYDADAVKNKSRFAGNVMRFEFPGGTGSVARPSAAELLHASRQGTRFHTEKPGGSIDPLASPSDIWECCEYMPPLHLHKAL